MGAFTGAEVDDVQRVQVRETIRNHLDRERLLAPKGLKVLSLFFLDAVGDYRVYEADGTARLGPIGELFEEELAVALAKPRNAGIEYPPVQAVHDGYFSQDDKGRAKDSRGDGEGDRSAYEKSAQRSALWSSQLSRWTTSASVMTSRGCWALP